MSSFIHFMWLICLWYHMIVGYIWIGMCSRVFKKILGLLITQELSEHPYILFKNVSFATSTATQLLNRLRCVSGLGVVIWDFPAILVESEALHLPSILSCSTHFSVSKLQELLRRMENSLRNRYLQTWSKLSKWQWG